MRFAKAGFDHSSPSHVCGQLRCFFNGSFLWLGLALCLMCAHATGRPLVFGYAVWWVPQVETIRSLPHVDRIHFIELQMNPSGRLDQRHGWPQEWQALREAAAVAGVPIDLALTLFSPADFNALFGSPERVKRLTQEVMLQAADTAVAGIHLDVEILQTVDPKAVLRYRAFVLDLARQLKALQPGRLLSVFLNHGAERQMYDASTLAAFDHVIVQGYDSHWVNSELAGPVAPLRGPDVVTWEGMRRLAGSLGVPPQRLLMGFPTFGYEWTVQPCTPRGKRVAPGETTVFGRVNLPDAPQVRHSIVRRVLAHGVHYDAQSGSAYYQINGPDDSCVVGWFEDWWTLQHKLDWVMKEQLAGVAFFPLGYDNTDLVAQAARRLRSPPP